MFKFGRGGPAKKDMFLKIYRFVELKVQSVRIERYKYASEALERVAY